MEEARTFLINGGIDPSMMQHLRRADHKQGVDALGADYLGGGMIAPPRAAPIPQAVVNGYGPPAFAGTATENAEYWAESYALAAEANGWKAVESIIRLGMYMQGTASAVWHRQMKKRADYLVGLEDGDEIDVNRRPFDNLTEALMWVVKEFKIPFQQDMVIRKYNRRKLTKAGEEQVGTRIRA